MEVATLHRQVSQWLAGVRELILTQMAAPLDVTAKSNRNDLVTNVDRASQRFIVAQIKASYPEATIVGEEGASATPPSLAGLVFFVDPIDGTMNFVRQRANFAVMIGVYQDGVALYGAILNVMRNELVAGGPNMPLVMNDQPLTQPQDLPLDQGLIGLSGPMLIHNRHNVAAIAIASSGSRLMGSAGMDFKAIAQGQLIGYISYLQPWDVAAGMAIGQSFGLQVTQLDGQAVDLTQAQVVVAAMPQAHRQCLTLIAQA